MQLDPTKTYAEIKRFTNRVLRIFTGESAAFDTPWRRIIEVQPGTVQVGDLYINNSFVSPPAAPTQDEKAAAELDSPALRLLFEVNWNQENRLRTLEGQEPVTRIAYRVALINLWKQLHS